MVTMVWVDGMDVLKVDIVRETEGTKDKGE